MPVTRGTAGPEFAFIRGSSEYRFLCSVFRSIINARVFNVVESSTVTLSFDVQDQVEADIVAWCDGILHAPVLVDILACGGTDNGGHKLLERWTVSFKPSSRSQAFDAYLDEDEEMSAFFEALRECQRLLPFQQLSKAALKRHAGAGFGLHYGRTLADAATLDADNKQVGRFETCTLEPVDVASGVVSVSVVYRPLSQLPSNDSIFAGWNGIPVILVQGRPTVALTGCLCPAVLSKIGAGTLSAEFQPASRSDRPQMEPSTPPRPGGRSSWSSPISPSFSDVSSPPTPRGLSLVELLERHAEASSSPDAGLAVLRSPSTGPSSPGSRPSSAQSATSPVSPTPGPPVTAGPPLPSAVHPGPRTGSLAFGVRSSGAGAAAATPQSMLDRVARLSGDESVACRPSSPARTIPQRSRSSGSHQARTADASASDLDLELDVSDLTANPRLNWHGSPRGPASPGYRLAPAQPSDGRPVKPSGSPPQPAAGPGEASDTPYSSACVRPSSAADTANVAAAAGRSSLDPAAADAWALAAAPALSSTNPFVFGAFSPPAATTAGTKAFGRSPSIPPRAAASAATSTAAGGSAAAPATNGSDRSPPTSPASGRSPPIGLSPGSSPLKTSGFHVVAAGGQSSPALPGGHAAAVASAPRPTAVPSPFAPAVAPGAPPVAPAFGPASPKSPTDAGAFAAMATSPTWPVVSPTSPPSDDFSCYRSSRAVAAPAPTPPFKSRLVPRAGTPQPPRLPVPTISLPLTIPKKTSPTAGNSPDANAVDERDAVTRGLSSSVPNGTSNGHGGTDTHHRARSFDEQEQARLALKRMCMSPTDPVATFVGSFQESLLSGHMSNIASTDYDGFVAELVVCGFKKSSNNAYPPLRVPFTATYYHVEHDTPYVGTVRLDKKPYAVPPKGMLQLTVFNPSNTPVKAFLVKYDVSDMPPLTKTFVRQRVTTGTEPPVLRFALHMKLVSPKRKKYYLYKSIRIVFAHRAPDETEVLTASYQYPDPPKYFSYAASSSAGRTTTTSDPQSAAAVDDDDAADDGAPRTSAKRQQQQHSQELEDSD